MCSPKTGLAVVWNMAVRAGQQDGEWALRICTSFPRKEVLPVAKVQERPVTLAPKFLMSR